MQPLATMALGVLIATGLNAYPVLAQESVGALAEAPYEGSDSTPSWHFSLNEARQIGEAIGIDWASAPFSVKQFRVGLEVELEHGSRDPQTDVTHNDPIVTAKIALAHLKESAHYYYALALMEGEEQYFTELLGTSRP